MSTGIPLEGAERQSITVKGIGLQVPVPYKEGHPLRSNEASVLNQTYAENLRNNLAKTVAKAISDANDDPTRVDIKALQVVVDKYVPEYDFGVRRLGAGTPVDPVEREALRLAKEQVREAYKAKGFSIRDVGADVINEKAAEAVEKYPQFKQLAAQNVKAKAKIGAEVLGDLKPDSSGDDKA